MAQKCAKKIDKFSINQGEQSLFTFTTDSNFYNLDYFIDKITNPSLDEDM